MKVLDNFNSPPMVMAPWVDYGNYPILESLIATNNKLYPIGINWLTKFLKKTLQYFQFAEMTN